MNMPFLNIDERYQNYLSLVASRFLQKFTGSSEYHYPYEKLYENLLLLHKSVHGETFTHPLDVDHYVLNIQLMVDQHEIWRRVSVPTVFSFRHLHNIIQTVFDWKNYHLYDFTIHQENKKRILVVTDKDEVIDFVDLDKIDIKEDLSLSLKDVITEDMEIIYEYDFGDSWEHLITLEKVEKVPRLAAKFIDGKGERPPEDVGGIPGFENYLQIISNEFHPDHQAMKTWAENQKERKQTKEQINKRLESILSPRGFSEFIF